ncbi:hypothetical protein LR48_Vigan05g182600 [Vigna angularis]|uniref:Uncharacterized protein n=1 Tax=Phaseolus angularis TaxID=3914 RepID=A0A0L9UND1_PHAAN|nr:hypothetical protein LR48_Vigan05g182600 [Vigna angularis]
MDHKLSLTVLCAMTSFGDAGGSSKAELAEEKNKQRNKDDGEHTARQESHMNTPFVSPGGIYTNQPTTESVIPFHIGIDK